MTELSRRRFVQSAAPASASMDLAGTQASGKVIGANDRLRIAVVGLNGRGKSHIGLLFDAEKEAHIGSWASKAN